MLSGIGGPAHLAEHGIPVRVARDGVGQNLQDHVDYVACFETPGKAFMGRSLKGSVDVVRAILRWKWSRSGLMTTPYRSEEHTSELQSLMRISYAVFCLKKTNKSTHRTQ